MMSDDTITGRARIAHELRRSERTVSRWIKRGILPVSHNGPFANNLLQARRSDIERIKAMFAGQREAA